LKKSAAVVLAAAISRVLPRSQLVYVGSDEVGFYCDFVANNPVNPEILALIEEQMRAIVKEDREFTHLEMISDNAADFFRDRGQKLMISAEKGSLIDVCRLGDFYCAAEGPFVSALGFFQLEDIEQGDDITRISGIIFPTKPELKAFIKRKKQAK